MTKKCYCLCILSTLWAVSVWRWSWLWLTGEPWRIFVCSSCRLGKVACSSTKNMTATRQPVCRLHGYADDVCSDVSACQAFEPWFCRTVICCFCDGRARLWLKGRRGGRGTRMRHLQTDRGEWVGGHRPLRGLLLFFSFSSFFPFFFLSFFCMPMQRHLITEQTSIIFPRPVITCNFPPKMKNVCLTRSKCVSVDVHGYKRLVYLAIPECTVCFSLKGKKV